MSARFEELAWHETRLGPLSLRRRRVLSLDDLEIFEVKLGEEYLMSSLFTEAEIALARLGLAGLGPDLDVVVGGLGLGYTARAALQNSNVRSLIIVDALAEVIGWHRDGLVPLGREIADDPRCRLVHADFFERSAPDVGFDETAPGRRFHAILLDIDHSPRHLLSAGHGAFYSEQGLAGAAAQLHPGGAFALWADGSPDAEFLQRLQSVFATATSHVVTFFNPLLECDSASTVYVAHTAPQG